MKSEQRHKMILLMINMFIAIASFGIIIPILPAYLESIGEGGTAAGLMIAIFAGAQLVMSPVAGKWTDQYGRRYMIILGLGGLTLSMFVFYFFDSIWWLYASRVVGGVGAALLIPAIFAYVADITTIDERAKGNSFVSAAMSLGFVVGPGIGGFLADFGLKMPILLSAILSLVAVLFSIMLLKESQTEEAKELTAEQVSESPLVKQLIQSVKKPYFIPLVITLVMSFGLMAYESILGLFVDNQFGATPGQIAILLTSIGTISVIVQLFVVERLVRWLGERTVLSLFLGVASFGFLLSLFAPSYGMFFAVTMFIFLATSILRPVLTTLISKLAGNEQGFAMGMNNAYMSIGNVLGPALAGVLFDVQITYPFILCLIVLAATTFVSIFWQRKHDQNKPNTPIIEPAQPNPDV
ncbi:MFS transporter [Halalkalibacterium halodurans]|uniref:MFS transporter n=1 Tax=Halalkalibacterium halodurans TaxID=86665 RepID=UPI002AA99618|nr:MFS transporter [Halalkalibacterium halodurans]MDY7222335.1 MFS transporter [Halalkalibacterium halodurans]MDY7241556.1 MFS transporter [Halalkalibacterium halodurans]MED4163541.1 MFS transporter [Halalkalibacterium halodurans]